MPADSPTIDQLRRLAEEVEFRLQEKAILDGKEVSGYCSGDYIVLEPERGPEMGAAGMPSSRPQFTS